VSSHPLFELPEHGIGFAVLEGALARRGLPGAASLALERMIDAPTKTTTTTCLDRHKFLDQQTRQTLTRCYGNHTTKLERRRLYCLQKNVTKTMMTYLTIQLQTHGLN